MTQQFFDECLAPLANLRPVGPIDSVDEFRHGNSTYSHIDFTKHASYVGEKLLDSLPFSFSSDDNAGIDGQSQDGGFHSPWRLLMPSSTSAANSPSSVTFEPLARADAIHSEIGRPIGLLDRMTRPVDDRARPALQRLRGPWPARRENSRRPRLRSCAIESLQLSYHRSTNRRAGA